MNAEWPLRPGTRAIICYRDTAMALHTITVVSLWAVFALCTGNAPFTVVSSEKDFTISIGDKEIIKHNGERPFLFVGMGTTHFSSYLGNYEMHNYLDERVPLTDFRIDGDAGRYVITLFSKTNHQIKVTLTSDARNALVLSFSESHGIFDRLWMRVEAATDEAVYGGGEQFSYFNLRGRLFPLWTGEQGVGRNKSELVTVLADWHSKAGGDYYSTYFPQPTFVSSRHYYCHVDTGVYSELDFTNDAFHEIYTLGIPRALYFNHDGTMLGLVQKLTSFLKRQPDLPEWVYTGAILGVQGGTEKMLAYLKQAREHGIPVKGLWIQDWVGRLKTSFGSRLFWNWEWNQKHYPGLDKEILRLKEDGVRLLAYINPVVNTEGGIFKEADKLGFLVKNTSGQAYVTDYGEFNCGSIDLTYPEAFEWYKGVIRRNLIDFGFGGWMADFGEYLPPDGVFHSGEHGTELHNKWPSLWARLNREVVEEAGKLGEILYFMRAGYTTSQEYSLMMWAGDQNVDFTYGDGLPSTIPAALSLAMSGMGLTHFDIGGYTSLPLPLVNLRRTEELFLRSAEMAVFTPVMRTHEGNRPTENWQVYSSDHTLDSFSRLVNIHAMLSPYTATVVKENARSGIPAQRPLFLHYDDDVRSYQVTYQYMYGRDLLVAPVHQSEHSEWTLYLPPDEWVHLISGSRHVGPAEVTVQAPLGHPPVFYRAKSEWSDLFERIRTFANKSPSEGTCDSENKKCP